MKLARTTAVAGMLLAGLAVAAPAHAGPVRVSFEGGRLTVLGNSADNQVTITRLAHGVRVVVDGSTVKLRPRPKPDTLNSIKVKGKGGNDVLTLVEAAGPLPDASLQGGLGDDRLVGGSGATRLIGKSGNDVLVGGAGPTFMDAGDGTDTLTGGSGPTTMSAGAGNDAMTGGAGAANLSGGAGDDSLTGGSGFTSLAGDGGNDQLKAGSGPNTMAGGDGNDNLTAGRQTSQLSGDLGDDTYAIDGDVVQGNLALAEAAGAGTDLVTFAATTTVGISLDLGTTNAQPITGSLGITLSSGTGLERVVGGSQADTFTGNSLVNTFTGGAGQDTFVHRGAGGGIDTVVDMNAAQGDQADFVTSGALSASAMTLNSAGTALRDAATGAFGFDFTAPVFNGSSFYVYGTTDTAPAGQLITFTGAGGFGQGSNVDSLITSHATNGATIGGAGGKDRIIDFSANGNSLIGRDGSDVLIGGDGDDALQGDRGFAPGVSDVYTGGNAADTFRFGEAFGGGALETFGAESVTDFGNGADTCDLFTGLSVKSGLGTTTVTIYDGATDFGTITATNGHNWVAGDFS
jgi:Ca2+-binding RTX toxin-like protein